jgi:hypothetical protein
MYNVFVYATLRIDNLKIYIMKKDWIEKIIDREENTKQCDIHVVRVRFYLKLKRRDNTCNGNGYGIWNLDWAWFRKRGSKRLWTQKLGNGDNGERCIG